MQLTLFNGSPRGKKSNTRILLDHFTRGFEQADDCKINLAYLVHHRVVQKHVDLFKTSENVIVAFPLYTDAMPGIVKYFFEALAPFCGREGNPRLGFIVQSGFPEAAHSCYVERYLEKLAKRLGCEYLGTVVKGGVEGIQVMPPWMTKKLFQTFFQLGTDFASTGTFNPDLLKSLAPRDQMSFGRIQFMKTMQRLGLTNFYWNSQLKRNGVFDQRFAQPYKEVNTRNRGVPSYNNRPNK